MIVEIELPKELEKYKDDFVAYAMEAIEIKKAEDDTKVDNKAVKKAVKEKVEEVKIDGKTWGKIMEEKKAKELEEIE